MNRRLFISSAFAYPFIASARPGRPAETDAPKAPYSPSPIFAGIDWAPADTIVRQAKDGDNWPVTWSDDDAIYTTFGDGTGFPPKTEKKLSCGFVKVTGSPANFTGTNIRSAAEQFGDGRQGKKGWGILSVSGVLYLWLGHADGKGGGAQLAWSKDHAKTWEFADWQFSDFGLIGFVNYGKDYANARDDFVYAYSHDGPLADSPADRFVLMRAPKDRLEDRTAWEFFVKIGAGGRPDWDRKVTHRGAVFTNPDACLRSAMTYQPALRRYLWWQHIPRPIGSADRGDTRFEGGSRCTTPRSRGDRGRPRFSLPSGTLGRGSMGIFRRSGRRPTAAPSTSCSPGTTVSASAGPPSGLPGLP